MSSTRRHRPISVKWLGHRCCPVKLIARTLASIQSAISITNLRYSRYLQRFINVLPRSVAISHAGWLVLACQRQTWLYNIVSQYSRHSYQSNCVPSVAYAHCHSGGVFVSVVVFVHYQWINAYEICALISANDQVPHTQESLQPALLL